MRLFLIHLLLSLVILQHGQNAFAVDVITILRVGAQDDGLPSPPATLTYTWSMQSKPNGYTSTPTYEVQSIVIPIDTGYTNKVIATIPNAIVGNYVFRVTVSDSVQSVTSDVPVSVVANKPPVVSAGPDLIVALAGNATLAGTVSDDGFPVVPGVTTATWKKDSGPGAVIFANASKALTTATFGIAGTYVLRLEATDGSLIASDMVTVTVNAPANLAPTAIAQTVSTSVNSAKTITLSGTDPEGSAVVTAGTTPPSHGTLTGSGPSLVRTYQPNAGYIGPDSFTFTVSDGVLTSAPATVTISVGSGGNSGDLNGDKVVNITDLTLVTSHFGQNSANPSWNPLADSNGDGVINITDLTAVTSHFGSVYP